MRLPPFMDRSFSLSLGCSLCVHAILVSGLFVFAASNTLAGKSGGSQTIYNVNYEGFGLPGPKTDMVPSDAVIAKAAVSVPEEKAVETQKPLLQPVSDFVFVEKVKKVEKPKPVTPQFQKVNQEAPLPEPQAASGNGTDTPGSFGTGGGSGGGEGSGNDPDGTGKGNFARAIPLTAPKPEYPSLAKRAGFEGKVVLAAEIGSDGKVRGASVQKSSGREDCDEAARETVLSRWRFEPARVDGNAIESKEKIVVVYNLQRF